MRSKLYQLTPSELQELLDTSNSYADVLRKLDMNEKGGNPKTLKRIINEYNLSKDKLNENRKRLSQKLAKQTHEKIRFSTEDIIIYNKYPNYRPYNLLKRLIKEGIKEYKCEICGISQWMNKPISLQLHHIDGNQKNNLLENLMILCPNCHSQTNNYSGKKTKRTKKNNKIKKVMPPISRKDLKNKIRNMPFVQIGKEFNVTDNTIRKWCKKYNLPYQVRKIKQYSDSQWEKI